MTRSFEPIIILIGQLRRVLTDGTGIDSRSAESPRWPTRPAPTTRYPETHGRCRIFFLPDYFGVIYWGAVRSSGLASEIQKCKKHDKASIPFYLQKGEQPKLACSQV